MTQHTPGPWKTIQSPCHPLQIVNRQSTIVCNVLADIDSMPECRANARLIAAAPDLLAIAKMVQQGMAVGMCLETWAELRDKLDDVIAKATGENLQETT